MPQSPGKSQSNNSGSDKRELYTIAQALQKPYHDLLFNVHRLIIKFNNWDGAYPSCPFIQLTTLDEGVDAKKVAPEIFRILNIHLHTVLGQAKRQSRAQARLYYNNENTLELGVHLR